MVKLPCCTTTISGQLFEQSRNDVPEAGVCARAGGKVVIQQHAMHETARRMSIRLVMATVNQDALIRRFMVRFSLLDRVRSQFKRHRYFLLFRCKTAPSATSLLSLLQYR